MRRSHSGNSTHVFTYRFLLSARKQAMLMTKLLKSTFIALLSLLLFACQTIMPPAKETLDTALIAPELPSPQEPDIIPDTTIETEPDSIKPQSPYSMKESVVDKTAISNIADSIRAEFTIRRGDLNDAYQGYFKIAQETQDKKAIKRAAEIASALNNINYIAQSSEYWLTLDPKEQQAYQLRFQALISTSQTKEAAQLLVKAMNNNLQTSFVNQEVSRNSREVEKINTIADAISLLPELYRNRLDILTVETRINFIQGDIEQAIENVRALQSRQGKKSVSADMYLILAFSQNQSGLPIDAIKTLEEAVRYHPDNLRLLTPLLDFLLVQGQLERADYYFEKASLERHQKSQLTLSYVGQMIENNFVENALDQLNEFDYQSSGLADQFHFLKANALALVDRKEEALVHLLQTNGILKSNATQQAALWMYELNQSEKINNMILSRINVPNGLDMVLEITSLHEEFKRLDLADELLFLTLQRYPDSDNIRYRRALVNEQIGLWFETEKELRFLIKKDAQNAQYLNALGYMLLSQPPRLDEAMTFIKSAHRLSPEDPAIIDSLGWGYYLQGNLELAINYLQEAWNLLNDPEIGAHLGEALWMRDANKASEVWQKSFEIDSSHKVLLETIQRLMPDSPLLQKETQTENTLTTENS
ncbi:tetratricopeptide repeat protein [Marinomonas agarivorans]|nr:tetratricopeptide repeat protein [Marinomonas agarivorans]